jgi:TetR/AcrR family transcriptional repressor of nem operon
MERSVRYGPGHREQTRERIVAGAARRFRADGYEATSIAAVMGEVGLTVGGFYAHFPTKEALFGEALARAGTQALADKSPAPELGPRAWIRGFVANYLTAEHLADRAGGCPLAALGGDIARAGEAPRTVYRDSAVCFVALLTDHLDGPAEYRAMTARAVASMCVGALTLARAGMSAEQAEELFDACADAVETLLR